MREREWGDVEDVEERVTCRVVEVYTFRFSSDITVISPLRESG